MAKRPTKIEKLRAQLADVQRQLEEAEQAERDERLQRITQALVRSGVLALHISPDEVAATVERALRDLAVRQGNSSAEEEVLTAQEEGRSMPAPL